MSVTIFPGNTRCREFGVESLGIKGDSRVVPVIMLQFSREQAVLIDNMYQAVSQPVAVLAVQVNCPLSSTDDAFSDLLTTPLVQSPHGYLPSSLSCSGAVQSIDTRDATRPVIAALLEAVWGASGPHVTWNPGTRSIEDDHLWSASATPWTTLNTELRLPFHVQDASLRAVVYNEVAAVIEALLPVQNLIRTVSKPLGTLLKVCRENGLVF
jgi:hypothetical protein